MKTRSTGKKLSPKFLFDLILFGLMGQVAWNVENMYFNTFLYNSIYASSSQAAIDGSINVIDAVSKMVAFSAVTAMLTSFIMGALSDKVGNRKSFISIGYIIWGVVTGSFGLISGDHISALFHITDEVKVLTATVWVVITMDCVMTFIGSTANDAAFNAWVTDCTDETNRGVTESILALLPVAAMGIVLGLGGVIIVGDNKQKAYEMFFLILGAVVSLCGVIGLFTIKDPEKLQKNNGGYFSSLAYVLRPSVIAENYKLYLTLIASCVYCVAVQVFFPYLIIYLEHSPDKFLDLGDLQITPVLIAVAVIALIAVVGGIIGMGKAVDRFGKNKFVIPLIICMSVGLLLLYFAHDKVMLLIGVIPTAIGYALVAIILNAAIRDFTPEDKAGVFQGIRMIFNVMIPMVLGPVIGKTAILNSGVMYENEYGVSQAVPTSDMFLSASVTVILALIPVIVILVKGGFSKNEKSAEE